MYIEEIAGGVRAIARGATFTTACFGLAKRGPVNQAETINNAVGRERFFGGLDPHSSRSFAARDFFFNGGAQAVIVRYYHADGTEGAGQDKASLALGGVAMEAAPKGPGASTCASRPARTSPPKWPPTWP